MKKKLLMQGISILTIFLLIGSGSASLLTHQNILEERPDETSHILSDVEEDWTKVFGSSDSEELGYDVCQTADGGYILTGETESFGYGKEDVLLIKTNEHGVINWDAAFGGNRSDVGWSIEQTTDAGYVIAGFTTSCSMGFADGWVIKTNYLGEHQWNITIGDAGNDVFYDIKQTRDDGYIMAGETDSFGNGKDDMWLVKLNENGSMEWNKTFGGVENDVAYSVHQCADGGYIITGYTQSYGVGWRDIWTIKTDSMGNKLWDKTSGGVGHDIAWEIKQTRDGGYIIAGYTDSFDVEYQDMFLIRFDGSGNQLWTNTFGGSNNDRAYSVKQTNDNGFILCGTTSVMKDSDWNYDFCIIKTDDFGNQQWSKTFGDDGDDVGRSIQLTDDSGYISTGYTHRFTNAGNPNVYLIKLSNQNKPPETPDKPVGDSTGNIGVSYQYSTQSVDPDGDQIWYQWIFGDGTISEWLGPFDSGETCVVSHSWLNKGDFSVKVKARDSHFVESLWSESLLVDIVTTEAWLFGKIANKELQSNSIVFDSEFIIYLCFDQFELKTYRQGVHFSVSKINGLMTDSFVAGKFGILEIS